MQIINERHTVIAFTRFIEACEALAMAVKI